MRSTLRLFAFLAAAGCADPVAGPSNATGATGGPASIARSSGGTGGDALVADAVAGDYAGATSALLISSCGGDVSRSYGVDFGPGTINCAAVHPTGSSYALTDDIIVLPRTAKGKVTQVRLWGQDVIGPDGIMHDTDPIAVATPVTPSSAGFTLHVHADNVPVYRLSGHTGGPRVAMIGTIAIGDIVYRQP